MTSLSLNTQSFREVLATDERPLTSEEIEAGVTKFDLVSEQLKKHEINPKDYFNARDRWDQLHPTAKDMLDTYQDSGMAATANVLASPARGLVKAGVGLGEMLLPEAVEEAFKEFYEEHVPEASQHFVQDFLDPYYGKDSTEAADVVEGMTEEGDEVTYSGVMESIIAPTGELLGGMSGVSKAVNKAMQATTSPATRAALLKLESKAPKISYGIKTALEGATAETLINGIETPNPITSEKQRLNNVIESLGEDDQVLAATVLDKDNTNEERLEAFKLLKPNHPKLADQLKNQVKIEEETKDIDSFDDLAKWILNSDAYASFSPDKDDSKFEQYLKQFGKNLALEGVFLGAGAVASKALKPALTPVGKKAKEFVDRNFTVTQGVDSKTFRAKQKSEASVNMAIEEIEGLTTSLERAAKKYKINPKDISKASAGNKAAMKRIKDQSEEAATYIYKFRQDADNVSREIRDTVTGRDSKIGIIIDESLGTYITSTKKAFDAPIFRKQLIKRIKGDSDKWDDALKGAASFLRANKDPNASDDSIRRSLLDLINEVDDPTSLAREWKKEVVPVSDVSGVNILMKKKKIPKPLHRVLGEVTNPYANMQHTKAKLIRQVAHHRLIDEIADTLKAEGKLVEGVAQKIIPPKTKKIQPKAMKRLIKSGDLDQNDLVQEGKSFYIHENTSRKLLKNKKLKPNEIKRVTPKFERTPDTPEEFVDAGQMFRDMMSGSYSGAIVKDNQLLNPLEGMFIDPVYAKFLKDSTNVFIKDGTLGKFLVPYSFVKGLSQASKTVLSPLAYPVNYLGGKMYLLANGFMPWTTKMDKDMLRLIYSDLAGVNDEVLGKLNSELTKYGIIDSNIIVSLMKENLKGRSALDVDGLMQDAVEKTAKLEQLQQAIKSGDITGTAALKAKDTLNKLGRKITEAYQAIDNNNKLIHFVKMKEVYSKDYPELGEAYKKYMDIEKKLSTKGISPARIDKLNKEKNQIINSKSTKTIKEGYEELMEAVSARTREEMPVMSQMPRAVKAMRYAPVGSFVPFPAEVVRNAKNIIKNTIIDATEGGAARKKLALQRVAGLTAISSIIPAMSAISMDMYGMDEDKDKALRLLGPSYLAGDARIYQSGIERLDNGAIVSKSIQAEKVNPALMFKGALKAITTILSSDNPKDVEQAQKMFTDYLLGSVVDSEDASMLGLSPALPVQAGIRALDIAQGEEPSYMRHKDWDDKAKWVTEPFQPTWVTKELQRKEREAAGNTFRDRGAGTMSDEEKGRRAALDPFVPKYFDITANGFKQFNKSVAKYKEARSKFNDMIRNPKSYPIEEYRERLALEYAKSVKEEKKALQDYMTVYDALKELGLSESEIIKTAGYNTADKIPSNMSSKLLGMVQRNEFQPSPAFKQQDKDKMRTEGYGGILDSLLPTLEYYEKSKTGSSILTDGQRLFKD